MEDFETTKNNALEGSEEQADVSEQLRKIGEEAEYGDKKVKKPKKVKKLAGFKKWLGASVLGASSLIGTVGCESKKSPPPTEAQKTQEIEKANDLLFKALEGFVCGEDNSEKDPGLIIGTGGGKYYRLSFEQVDSLTKITFFYAQKMGGINFESKNAEALKLKLKQAEHMKLAQQIENMGSMVDFENLPQDLKEKEEARREAAEQMKNNK